MLEVKLPLLAENLEGGGVIDVKIKPGSMVSEGDTLIEIDAGKATLEVPSTASGKVVELKVKKGDDIKVGQTICILESSNGEAPAAPPKAETPKAESPRSEPAPAPQPTSAPRPAPASDAIVLAGPATRRLAREMGVPLHAVSGSGREGRVTEDDVRSFAGRGPSTAVATPALPKFEQFGPVERQQLTHIRKLTAKQMALAWSLIPHVTQHDKADITDLESFRKQQSSAGVKLTVTAFALKAAAVALKQFPTFNASLDPASEQLILKKYYHVGVAVDTEHGLLVPVIRDVDQKSVQELAADLSRVAEAARQRKADLSGGTFTITNLGGIGGTGFTPIVNWPEVAILGLSRSQLEPVVRDGQIVSRLMLPLSLSYDHRVIDGAAAARFTRFIAELLENPWKMVLHA